MHIEITQNEPAKMLGFLMAVHKVFPEAVQDLLQLTRSAKNGITVEIVPYVFKQTNEQRGYYWQEEKKFAAWAGNTPDEMHNHLLCECYGTDFVSSAIGMQRRPQKRSSEATKIEYSELIETLIRVAANFGYVVPPPVKKKES